MTFPLNCNESFVETTAFDFETLLQKGLHEITTKSCYGGKPGLLREKISVWQSGRVFYLQELVNLAGETVEVLNKGHITPSELSQRMVW